MVSKALEDLKGDYQKIKNMKEEVSFLDNISISECSPARAERLSF